MTAERDGSLYYARWLAPPTVDQILKTMSIYELHGLNDIAVDTAVIFSDELQARRRRARRRSAVLDDPISCRSKTRRRVSPSRSAARACDAQGTNYHLERERGQPVCERIALAERDESQHGPRARCARWGYLSWRASAMRR